MTILLISCKSPTSQALETCHSIEDVESLLHQIVIAEGSKAYLTKQVDEDNRQHFFKPYKELCAVIGAIILECNAAYKYPRSLASTIVEMAHFQTFFMKNLPSLTDFGNSKEGTEIVFFLNDLVFSSLRKSQV